MSRTRTATNVLEMRGAFKKNPKRGRERENEPVVTEPIGNPPEHMADDARKCWLELVELCPLGVLSKMDRPSLEMAASLLAKCRRESWDSSPAVLGRLDILLGKFGMTPADRSRVTVPKDTPKNQFADL